MEKMILLHGWIIIRIEEDDDRCEHLQATHLGWRTALLLWWKKERGTDVSETSLVCIAVVSLCFRKVIYRKLIYDDTWIKVHDNKTEKPRTISVNGNVEKQATMLKDGKYLAVAKEEWHEGKRETGRKKKGQGQKKGRKEREKHMYSLLQQI